ncbi:TAXI family TRAP transporter solute-binding subunit [Phytohabitans houttuyneae]|uniref:C4-dicarboxylate ABC transporter substrate-binding protein n=1 Tax=Phytohabitans houttuyneae TaxID=1076126 RepID=A0A6V8KKQ6_9ACTN|nr:TAXI family TRAP transporter solute-binding subunit [Phytohabitans houttuyneae]GFJ85762.1 C4-dicarboxylate ABC transporter substrate-binding protein [Phytohabitans houttuyneae]
MTRPRLLRRATALLAAVALAAGCAPDPPTGLRDSHLVLGTGNTSGVFYQVGGAYADVITTHLPGYEAIVAPTAGSADNLLRMGRGDVDISLTFADVAADAVRGRGAFADGAQPLRALAVVYHGYTHLVVRADAGIKTPADLRGKRVSTGTVNSGTEFLALRLIRAAGLDPDRDIQRSSLSLAATTRGLADGTLDATFWSGGLPTVGITELMSNPKAKMRFLPLDGLQPELDRLYPATYGTGRIPASTYGLPGDIPTVTVGNLVVVEADMPETLAHDLTALIFKYRQELVNGHPEWGSTDREAAGRTGVVPLHPGAQRFYQGR